MMQNNGTTQLSIQIDNFLLDRKAANKSPKTIEFYSEKLDKFTKFCYSYNIYDPKQIDATHSRRFLIWLRDDEGHTPGGVHAYYRSVKVFVRWWALETDLTEYYRLFQRVKAPKVDLELLQPVSLFDVGAMLNICCDDWYGLRDQAMILVLLDTGVRAGEFLNFDISDIDFKNGSALVRKGKGSKDRTVFIGEVALQAVLDYLENRSSGPLWTIQVGSRLSYDGLRGVIAKCAAKAGIITPSLHSFRRAFAVNMLRNGVDLETLRRLMGHKTILVTQRYLALVNDDLKKAHDVASPVDTLKKLTD